jgi:hypothetical protein
MDAIREGLLEIVSELAPASVRQVFYQCVVRGFVEKTEGEYNRTVCRLLAEMRRAGTLPYSAIADGTRWMRKPQTYTGLAALLERQSDLYRRDLWAQQTDYIEIWIEKEALAGVIVEVTAEYDVPLMVTRGYASLSYLHSAAEVMAEKIAEGKLVYIFQFGDHDPSGVDIAEKIDRDLNRLAWEALVRGGQIQEVVDWDEGPRQAFVRFERVAVTEDQIADWNLPTRPTKRSDPRAKDFEGESVELDAIPPDRLRELVRECIERHVDQEELARLREVEASERETLERFAGEFEAGS